MCGQDAISSGADTTSAGKNEVSVSEDGNEGSGTQTVSGTEENTAESRMLNDLVAYFSRFETMYGDFEWLLASFEKFNNEKTWENLEIARASLFVTKKDIAAVNQPEQGMTWEDQKELMDRGVDVSFMESLNESLEGDQITLLNACANLYYYIMDDVFFEDDWDVCMEHVIVLKEMLKCDVQYLANMADWVLASVNDDEFNERVYNVLAQECPMICACQAAVLEDPETMPDRAPDVCLIMVANVSKEEVLEYQTELEEAGIKSLASAEKDGTLNIYYEYEDSVFLLNWKEDTANIYMKENPVCLVQWWYPLAVSAANE